MADVFVSYKAEDRERLRPLVAALEADGLSVWWDAHIGGGDEWRDTIARQLDQARCVIVAWSRKSTGKDGRFVRDEASRAVGRGVYLPVTIDKVVPPLGFGENQCLSLAGWKGDASDPRWQAVRNAVRSRLGLSSGAAVVRTAQPLRVDRRMLLGAGGVALLALGGAGAWLFRRAGGGNPDSVAVLPFANLSGDPAQAYFSDGMAEELRNALARIPGLKVMARTSSEMLRDSDAKAAAGKLGVATILTGSVRRSPSTIRVSAQLIDGADGLERWSQSFDRPAGDVLNVQTSIAENVAQQLRGQFAGSAGSALVVAGTRNAEAQDLVLQATARTNDDEAGFRQALALADAAIALDPKYAVAYALKARMTALLASFFARSAADNRAGLEQAVAIARRAIAIDPNVPEAHAAMATIRRNQLDLGDSLAELAKAASLPGCPATITAAYASALSDCGQFDRALRVWQTASDRDPLNAELIFFKAMILASARRFNDSFPLFEAFLKDHPDRLGPRNFYAGSLLFAGRTSDAARQFALMPTGEYHRLVGEAAIADRAGGHATAKRNMALIHAHYGSAANYQYAQIAAQSGDLETGIAALNAAWIERDPGLPRIKVDPFLDPLRKDPRFAAVVAKLNFPSADS